MPLALVRAYLGGMETVRARETLSLVTAVALGTGSLKRHEASRLMSSLERAASGTGKRIIEPVGPASLAAMGIAIEVEKVKRDE